MNSFEVVIKKAISPATEDEKHPVLKEQENESEIENIAQDLLKLLTDKTPKNKEEEDLIYALQRYLNK